MKTIQVTTIKRKWCSGDFVYGAISTSDRVPGSVHHIVVDGRELPVAQLAPLACNEYSLVRWIKRTEPFPEPIKGFNRKESK